MRHNNNSRRSRGKGRKGGGNNRMQVFDSNGPEVRIRGTAQQVADKYVALAKDASGSGDWVLAQNYLQHAEHYQRIYNSFMDENEQPQKVEDLNLPEGVLTPASNNAEKEELEVA